MEERPTVAKCEKQVKALSKILERLDEAEALYGVDRKYAALSKVGGAYTSLALAYSKDLLTKDEWKELSGILFGVREGILKEVSLEDLLSRIDSARGRVERRLFEKFTKCLK